MIINDIVKEVALESISEYIGILSQTNSKENKEDIQNAIKTKKRLIYENDEKFIYNILSEYNEKLGKIHCKK